MKILIVATQQLRNADLDEFAQELLNWKEKPHATEMMRGGNRYYVEVKSA